MRWKTEVQKKPYAGQKRVGTVFAWLPIKSENGEHVWLEHATIVEEYRIDPEGHWVVVAIK